MDVTGGTAGLLIPPLSIADKSVDRLTLYYAIVIVTALVLVLQNFIVSSHLGRSLQAIRDDERAAAALGVNVAVQKLRVFVLSAVLAGLAGIGFSVVSQQVSPSLGEFPVLVSILTIAVVGGLGTRYGPVLGAIVVVTAPQLLTRFGELQTLVYGLCLLLFLIFLPNGLSGLLGSQSRPSRMRLFRRPPSSVPANPAVKKGVGQ
jgi:branched-chain amino acid transport system permease protein